MVQVEVSCVVEYIAIANSVSDDNSARANDSWGKLQARQQKSVKNYGQLYVPEAWIVWISLHISKSRHIDTSISDC